jgi:signal transduction histidine kinase
MAEIGLQCPRIVALASQREATGMPQHMGVSLDPQLGLDAGTLHHARKACRGEGRAALRGEHERRLGFLLPLKLPQRPRALTSTEIELRTHRVSVSMEPHNELPQVLADRGQLQQVFQNLIMNAIEAMHATPERSRVLRVRSDIIQDSNQIVVSIADSGAGIGENKDRIFEPFFTTKSTGTGIGLTICRTIIESHGGLLEASENRPYGTIFEVVLPIEAAGSS